FKTIEIDFAVVSSTLQPCLVPRSVQENAAHGFGGGGEEVTAAVPVLSFFHIHEAEIRLMHESSRLERLAGLFQRQLLPGKLAQLVINQWQQLLRSVRIALLDSAQNARDLAHEAEDNRAGHCSQVGGRVRRGSMLTRTVLTVCILCIL